MYRYVKNRTHMYRAPTRTIPPNTFASHHQHHIRKGEKNHGKNFRSIWENTPKHIVRRMNTHTGKLAYKWKISRRFKLYVRVYNLIVPIFIDEFI